MACNCKFSCYFNIGYNKCLKCLPFLKKKEVETSLPLNSFFSMDSKFINDESDQVK